MNYDEIKKLIQDMGDSKIDCLDIEFPEGIKISMKKNANKIVEQEISAEPKKLEFIRVEKQSQEVENCNIVTSPMVGTFYSSDSPKEAAFVKIGDNVKKGQVLCVIEAMKLMNEIESEYDGEIIDILVRNKDMVDFGKPLFKIK